MQHNKVPLRKGADDAEGSPKGISHTAWGMPGHQSAKYSSSLTNVRVRVGGGGGGRVEAGGNSIGGGGGGKPKLTAIIQAEVCAFFTAAM